MGKSEASLVADYREEEEEGLLSDVNLACRVCRCQRTAAPSERRRHVRWIAVNAVVLALLVTVVIISVVSQYLGVSQQEWVCNGRSLVYDGMKMKPKTLTMDGTLLDSNHVVYRQPPSAEVDAAWFNLTTTHLVWVTSDEIVRMGKDPANAAKFPESFGLGPDAYAGEVDIGHKIHCLNFLRQQAYFDHYHLEKFPDRKVSRLHEAHLEHCLWMLLQHLQCGANTDVVLRGWVDGFPDPFADFSINRQCGDFEAVQAWKEQRRVSNDLMLDWQKPRDVPLPSLPEELKRLFREEHRPVDGTPDLNS